MRAKLIDHIEYPKSLKKKSDSELWFIVKDCKEAIAANRSNPNCRYYADEINYCAMELKRREMRTRKQYKSVNTRTTRGLNKAEQLKNDGWNIVATGMDIITFEK